MTLPSRRFASRGAAAAAAIALWATFATFPGAMPAAAQGAAEQRPLYKDRSQPVERRVEDLLARMTLEEKAAQLVTIWEHKGNIQTPEGAFSPEKASQAFPNGLGQIARPSDKRGVAASNAAAGATAGANRDARDTADYVNAAQRWAVERTRLGIPILMHEEALHGYVARGATSFPQSIALASSWDPELVERVFAVAAREMRARGTNLALAPVVDVARDPRWGRIEETYGEDPYLVSEMGLAAIRGFQGRTLPLQTRQGAGDAQAHDRPRPARERHQRRPGPDLRAHAAREFLPAVRARGEGAAGPLGDGLLQRDRRRSLARQSAGCCNDVLRGEWGFQGAVVSDYFAIREMVTRHRMFGDIKDAAERAIKSGVDVETPDGEAYVHLPELVRSGRVPQALVDEAVRRMLRLKFEAGLFENPYADAAAAERKTATPDAVALAREAARRSIVLLRNEGDLLPLDAAASSAWRSSAPTPATRRSAATATNRAMSSACSRGCRSAAKGRFEVDYAEGVRLTESRSWSRRSRSTWFQPR